jgi:D-alanyl-D-alanine carboxypeptidase
MNRFTCGMGATTGNARLLNAFFLVAIIFAGAQGFARSASQPISRHPEVAAAIEVLDAWIAATVASREQPGLSVGIVWDQDLIWSKGYGFADVRHKIPAGPSTLYRVASISKLFTATAVLQLRDAGKLSLDDPVARHLDWFKIRAAQPEGPPITIRHLLTHTSGLPREALGLNWTDLKFPAREAMIRGVAEQDRVFPVETEWKYSNLGFSLAGEIVSKVSGEPWHQYVENRILRPLGMTATHTLPLAGLAGLATGYERRLPGTSREVAPFVDIAAERPAGNLASSVEDLAKFVALQFREEPAAGSQILRGDTLKEMHRVHWLKPDWQSGWGLGFSIRRTGSQIRIGHGGSLPGHRTQIEFVVAEKLGVIVLTNANDGEPLRYVNQAFILLSPAIAKIAAASKVAPVADPGWEKYVGTYTSKQSDIKIRVLNGQLTLIDPGADDPWESRAILRPAGSHRFQLQSSTGTAAIGEILTFELDAQGRVVRASLPNSYWLRQ